MIRLQSLGKKFGKRYIHQHLSMDIPTGERLCLVGGSGVGKSILMKMMLGLEDYQEGHIFFEEVEIGKMTEQDKVELMQKCGVVFQGAALFDSLTVRENIGLRLDEERELSGEEIDQRVAEVLEAVHLNPSIMPQFPAQLSGGMQKRVAIARAIVHQPTYLFYDEPTTGLDPENAGNIDQLILTLSEIGNTTSVIITHDLETIKKVGTQVAMLSKEGLIFHDKAELFWSSMIPEVQRFVHRSQ
ncbi:MAG: ATP-binding cassette domain-containing protein [Bacteroidota bacterium]